MTVMTLEPNKTDMTPVLTEILKNIRYTAYSDDQGKLWVTIRTPDGKEDLYVLDELIDLLEDICKG